MTLREHVNQLVCAGGPLTTLQDLDARLAQDGYSRDQFLTELDAWGMRFAERQGFVVLAVIGGEVAWRRFAARASGEAIAVTRRMVEPLLAARRIEVLRQALDELLGDLQ